MSDKNTQKIENTLQITGKSFLEKPLEFGKEYDLKLRGTVNKKSLKDHDDGTAEQLFNIRQEWVVIVSEKEIIRTVQKKRSKQQRKAWYFIWQQEGEQGEFEDFYDNKMAILNGHLSEVNDFLKTLIK